MQTDPFSRNAKSSASFTGYGIIGVSKLNGKHGHRSDYHRHKLNLRLTLKTYTSSLFLNKTLTCKQSACSMLVRASLCSSLECRLSMCALIED